MKIKNFLPILAGFIFWGCNEENQTNVFKINTFAIFFFISITIISLSGCENKDSYPDFEPDTPDVLSDDVYEIYTVLINEYYSYIPALVAPQATDTTQDCSLAYYLQLDSLGIDSTVIAQAVQLNKKSYFLDNKIKPETQFFLLSNAEMDYYKLHSFQEMIERYNANTIFFWGLPYIYETNIPEQKMAVFSYNSYCGPMCASWYLVVMEKKEGKWKIRLHQLTAIS